ncbi:MAG TPA: 50S ribosomal protein L30 [Candidatus Bathyarchaeia archaeon]|nr:50S ribosomal protein L30 [Candidatus Bathyarchaeia archaeon]
MEQPAPRKCLAVIRVRGVSDIHRDIKETMNMLRLRRNCHATLIDDRPAYLGMLQKAQSYLAWGEISKETLKLLLTRRGRLVGNKKLTDEYAQKVGKKSLDELAEALVKGEIDFRSLPSVKPVFRLHPPTKGFKQKVKRSYQSGGVAGYRGEAVNKLLKQMI